MDFDWKRGLLILVLVIVLIIALYFTTAPIECSNFDCFQENMINCQSAKYVNEEQEASWGYEIIGKKEEQCEIKVTLLSAKEGSLDLRQYEGNSMNCLYELGISAYPERELDLCHGKLKENIQSVIIENLHKYIVDNLGEISEELGGV